jgi:hypothetical protein
MLADYYNCLSYAKIKPVASRRVEFVQKMEKIKSSTNLTRQLQVWEEVRFQAQENEDTTIPKPACKAFLEHRTVLLRQKGLTGKKPLAPQNL